MNRGQAEEHAQTLFKKRASVYISKINIASSLGFPVKKFTDAGHRKVESAFLAMVANSRPGQYPAIEKMYAEERVKK